MVKLVKQHIFSEKIKEKNLPVFGSADIQAIFGIGKRAASMVLHRYAKKNIILRIKRGLYSLQNSQLSELFIANKLYEPSYISREFALSYHRVIPETVYEITSVTPKATRRFEKLNLIFSYRNLKKSAYAGYTVEKIGELSFRVADPEKAFVDANYFRLIDGLEPLSRFDKEKIDSDKALNYSQLFGNNKLANIIKTALKS